MRGSCFGNKEHQGMANKLMQDSLDFKNEINSSSKEGGGVPSGFVLKLYQMVNNAPDEVISVRIFVILFCEERKRDFSV
jgi:hypothetical protein